MADDPKPARNTVWIRSKLPMALELYLEEKGLNDQGKPVFLRRYETRTTIKGINSPGLIATDDDGAPVALTEISAAFWNEWLNMPGTKNFKPLKSGAIRMQPTRERALAEAIDEKTLRTGLEPLDPDKPGAGLERVPEKEQKAARAMGGAMAD